MKISLDTNVLIDTPEIVFDKTKEFVISFKVIQELDNLKRNPDLKRSAQSVLKNIRHQVRQKKIEILNMPKELGDSPDEIIIQDTIDAKASFLTGDFGAELIALAAGVEISGFEAEEEINWDYKGYRTVPFNEEYTKTIRTLKEMPPVEFEHSLGITDPIHINEYVIVDDGTELPDIWKKVIKPQESKLYDTDVLEDEYKMTRISQKMSPYTAAGIKGTAPLDPIQMCTLDAVFDPDIPLVIVDGALGTGKTMLSMMSALATVQGEKRHKHYDQVFVTASPESVNKALYTGYKPGTSEAKLSGHLAGFRSNLKFLLDPTRVKENRKSKNPDEEEETPSSEAWRDYFTIVEIDEMQGMSLHHSILLVDEYQKLSADSLKLILSRIAEGSKVILMGDTQGQVYGLNRSNEGFRVLYKHLGLAHEMGFVKLENIYRSELSRFVVKVFED